MLDMRGQRILLQITVCRQDKLTRWTRDVSRGGSGRRDNGRGGNRRGATAAAVTIWIAEA